MQTVFAVSLFNVHSVTQRSQTTLPQPTLSRDGRNNNKKNTGMRIIWQENKIRLGRGI